MARAGEAGLLVIGGSHAGHQAALSARSAGYQGSITVLSAEQELPYQRPPLSKAYLMGKQPREALLFRPKSFYEENGIDIRLGATATSIDTASRTVGCGGAAIAYDTLVLATGARVRRIDVPGADLAGVHYIRTLVDIDSLSAALDSVSSVVVIGAGFIGLETAAALRALGREVTIVEPAERPMARGVGVTVGRFFAQFHDSRGVALRLRTGVEAIEGRDGRVSGVVLTSGESVPADLVVVGIGVLPNQEIAAEAGIECADGILIDAHGRTNCQYILAAGDCTRFHCRYAEGLLRLESVQNATDQARAAGASAAGQDNPYDSVPWFWSDQFDRKLQMAGITVGHDDEIIRGDVTAGTFSVFYFKGERWLGTDAINQPANHIGSRRLLEADYALSKAEAADETLALKDLVRLARKK